MSRTRIVQGVVALSVASFVTGTTILIAESSTAAPNHVAAAGKLLTSLAVSDIFDVGAVECPHPSHSGDTP